MGRPPTPTKGMVIRSLIASKQRCREGKSRAIIEHLIPNLEPILKCNNEWVKSMPTIYLSQFTITQALIMYWHGNKSGYSTSKSGGISNNRNHNFIELRRHADIMLHYRGHRRIPVQCLFLAGHSFYIWYKVISFRFLARNVMLAINLLPA